MEEYECDACQDTGTLYINGKWQICGCRESAFPKSKQPKTPSTNSNTNGDGNGNLKKLKKRNRKKY